MNDEFVNAWLTTDYKLKFDNLGIFNVMFKNLKRETGLKIEFITNTF